MTESLLLSQIIADIVQFVRESLLVLLMTKRNDGVSLTIKDQSLRLEVSWQSYGYQEKHTVPQWHLLGRRHVTVEAGSDAFGKLTLHHVDYERFLDMRRIHGAKRRSRKIHNRFIFGAYSSIAKRLMTELKDDLTDSWKG